LKPRRIIPTQSKEIIFSIPQNLISNFEGYELLCYISFKSYSTINKNIRFDFSKNDYFEANLCSPFGALLEGLRERGNTIFFDGLNSSVEEEFIKNGFYKLVNAGFSNNDSLVTIMDFKKFTLLDNIKFQDYINEQLLAQKDFPYLTDLLKKKINKSILEIFNNAHTHGGCEFVYTCGQYSVDDMKLKFTISDMGTTIRKNVNDYFKSKNKIDGKDAILWAVQEGNTTKNGSIPGGLGLSLIRSFLTYNEGVLQIISSNGYWEEKNGSIFDNTFQNRFLGTIVNFEFNLSDKKSYALSSEIDPKNVF
jgi:hypothetical protein